MTAQVNSVKIDELIEYLEVNTKLWSDFDNDKVNKTINIALAALKAHKAGYKMYTYDYSERDIVPAECELSKILEGLEK